MGDEADRITEQGMLCDCGEFPKLHARNRCAEREVLPMPPEVKEVVRRRILANEAAMLRAIAKKLAEVEADGGTILNVTRAAEMLEYEAGPVDKEYEGPC